MADDRPYIWEGKTAEERKALFDGALNACERFETRPKGKGAGARTAVSAPRPEPAAGPAPATFTAHDLMQMVIPPPRWAVEIILPQGLSVLAGKPKLGKSWLVLHLALAVSAGGIALGHVRVEGGSVLYISLEDTKRRLQSRIRRLLGPDEQPSPRLHLTHDWPRMDKGGLDAIAKWIESHRDARLVIIDTWARFKPSRPGKSDYDIDYADGSQVKALADRLNISLAIVHHCRKLGAADAIEEVSGSVGLTGACDGILVLRRERGQHDATLIVTGRDVDEQELALSFTKERCLWQLMGPAEEYRITKDRAEVLALLETSKRPMKVSEAVPLLNKTPNAVKLLFWKMANDGQIEALGSGLYALQRKPEKPEKPGNSGHHGNRPVSDADDDGKPQGNRDDPFETPWG